MEPRSLVRFLIVSFRDRSEEAVMSDVERHQTGGPALYLLAHEVSTGLEPRTSAADWQPREREMSAAYDTADGDLELLGITLSRVPLEVGALWRLELPRGEQVEAWEPGNNGVTPPAEIARLIEGVVSGKGLVPAPPVSKDPGAIRLRAMVQEQRRSLLTHDPGTRLGDDPENLHQHRVAARRTRAYLRAARAYLDPAWQRSLSEPLGELGQLTGPVRDLDVLLAGLRDEIGRLDEAERPAGDKLVSRLESRREGARQALLDALDAYSYLRVIARMRQPPRLAVDADAVPLERIARKEFRRVVRAVDRLGAHPDDAAVHGLRIKLKRARYAAELASAGEGVQARFLTDAKALQELLGEHQDTIVAEELLRAAGVVDGATAAAFVAGRIAERQRARRERVTELLPAAWRRLRKSGGRLGS
jgi:CHAD domain-containing protein